MEQLQQKFQELEALQKAIDNTQDPFIKGILQEKHAQLNAFLNSLTPILLALLQERYKALITAIAQKLLAPTPQPLPQEPPKQELIPASQEPIPASKVPISSPGQVVVHNDIYKVNLGKLGARELNLLFSLFNRLKDQQGTRIRFSPQEIRGMMAAPKLDHAGLLKAVRMLLKNVESANFREIARVVENGETLPVESTYMLFSHYSIAMNEEKTQLRYLDVGVNTHFYLHLFNQLSANFTTFQLKTFLSLRSKYAKNLYRLLVRFEDVNKLGECEVLTYKGDFEGFKEFMGIPATMRTDLIDTYILKPACRELGVIFEEGYDPKNPNRNLPYEMIFYTKQKKGKGGKIVGITFHFKPHPHADMQKAILKRHSQNRAQDVNLKTQKELEKQKEKLEREQEKAKRPHYNKQERKTLNGFCGLIGPLHISIPDYTFQNVRLVSVKTGLDNDPSIIGLFEIINPISNDYLCARCCKEHMGAFKVNKKDHFTHVFKDVEDFVVNFSSNAR